MKSILTSIAASSLLAALAIAQPPRYTLKDLGPVGGTPGQPYIIAKNGLVGGAAAVHGGRMHAVLWNNGPQMMDIGTPGLGGHNSAAFGVNGWGQAVGEAETETSDPSNEDFCGFNAYGFPSAGFPSAAACLPFVWQNGLMKNLPTLGGPNGVANMINNLGDVVGWAENNTHDAGCSVHQFKPVIWKNGKIQSLPTYGSDQYGVAAQINDIGQVVGASGTCATFNSNTGLYLTEKHALLWENGTVTNLLNLGGTGANGGHHACAINNRGQAVGHSDLPNDTTFHAVLWTNKTSILDLGTLDGDPTHASLAIGINDGGEVVGASFDGSFNPRAVLWQNGVIADLNTLIPTPAPLFLLFAFSINSNGEIVGFGVHKGTGEVHGFLATPTH